MFWGVSGLLPLSVQVVSWALILPLIPLPGLLLLQAGSHSFAKCYDLSRALAAPSPGPIWKLISLFYHTLGYGKNLGCGVRPQFICCSTACCVSGADDLAFLSLVGQV